MRPNAAYIALEGSQTHFIEQGTGPEVEGRRGSDLPNVLSHCAEGMCLQTPADNLFLFVLEGFR